MPEILKEFNKNIQEKESDYCEKFEEIVKIIFDKNCDKWVKEDVNVVKTYDNLNTILTKKIHDIDNLSKKIKEAGDFVLNTRRSVSANLSARNKFFNELVDKNIKLISDEYNKFKSIKDISLKEILSSKENFLEKANELCNSVKKLFQDKVYSNLEIINKDFDTFKNIMNTYNSNLDDLKKTLNDKLETIQNAISDYTTIVRYSNDKKLSLS